MAADDVDDREPPVAESDRPVDPQPLAVGTPMAQHVAHALEARLVHASRGSNLTMPAMPHIRRVLPAGRDGTGRSW